MSKKIYISYSHKDERWKDLLLTRLKKQYIPVSQLIVRDDRAAESGEDWQETIVKDIAEAGAAILLVSVHFLNSDFKLKAEIPRLLEYRNKKNLKIFPLIVSPCPWQNVSWLNKSRVFPGVGDLSSSGSRYDIEEQLTRFVSQLSAHFSDDHHEKNSIYRDAKSFEEKIADIFLLMGFEVETRRRIAGNEIDSLIKKKKPFGNLYDFYVCECKNYNKPVGVEWIKKYVGVAAAVKQQLRQQHPGSSCNVLIISSSGFTESAKEAAQAHGIILTAYDRLLAELMNFDRYLTNLIRNFEEDPLIKLYIQQDVFPESEKKSIDSFTFIDKWLTEPGRKQFILLGDYGTGKTSLAKKLAYDTAKAYKREPGITRIPFLVDLRQCPTTLSLNSLLHEQLLHANIRPVDEEIFLKLLAEGKILLIFDAFDEIAAMSNAEVALSDLRQLNEAVKGEARVILTSRTHYFRDKNEVDRILRKGGEEDMSEHASILYREISGKPEYEIVYLKEFDDGQVGQYLEKALKDRRQEAYEKIKRIYNLEDLSHRPVLLDMIVKTLPRIQLEGKNELNVIHLYEAYTQSWFDREDHRLRITRDGKHELVEELAFRLWHRGERSIHYSELSNILSHHLKERIQTGRDLETADYEVRTASFLVRDSEGNYGFVQKSFLEFFMARKIKKALEKGESGILDTRRLSIEIIFFLKYMVNHDDIIFKLLKEILSGNYRERVSENALVILSSMINLEVLYQRFSLSDGVIKSLSGKQLHQYRQYFKKHLPDKIDLKTADFRGMEFIGMTFENTDARGGNFQDCIFKNCTFRNSNFKKASFVNAQLTDCDFEANNFTGAAFKGSNLDTRKLAENNTVTAR